MKFNMHNLTYRIIIITFSTGNCGISLHDNSSPNLHPDGFPRVLISYIHPSPEIRAQSLNRHIRTGITSKIVSTLIVSTNIAVDGILEREVLYAKSNADTNLINSSAVSTFDPSTFPVLEKKVSLDMYTEMMGLINDMDVYVVDE
jgi:hypothetical protein